MIAVVICDDDPIVREALGSYVDREQDLVVAAMTETAEDAVALLAEAAADVVVMDLALPGMDGIEATRLLRALHPAPAVLVLTTFGTDDQVRSAIAAGAAGFLLKSASAAALVAAIRAAAAQAGTLITPELASRIAIDPETGPAAHAPVAPGRVEDWNLTDREAEVLTLLCSAESNAGIATALSLSESTVKSHVSSLMTKLGCVSRLQVALCAFEQGLAAPPLPILDQPLEPTAE